MNGWESAAPAADAALNAPARRFAIAMVAACPFPSPRGTPLRIEKLAAALAARGHEVHVVTYHLAVGDAPAGVHVHRTRALPFRGALAPGPTLDKLAILDPLLVGRLRGVLARHTIDVVHAHHYEGLAVALAAARFAGHAAPPVVYDAHTLLASELPEYRLPMSRGAARGIGAFIDARLPRRAAHVVAVTERLRARLVAEFGVAAARASVVPNGVERAFFDACGRAIAARGSVEASPPPPPLPPSSLSASLSAALSAAPSAQASVRAATLVFSGNLAAYQGVDLMLEAFAAVRRERADVRLAVLPGAGAGVDAAALARVRDAAVRFGVADAIEIAACAAAELPERLAAADIALSPRPRADGLPMKVLNYMAAALPTIAFRDAAGPLEDGRTGVLVGDATAPAFARAIVRLLDDRALATRLGVAARETIAARYTWEAAAASLETLYASLVAPRSGAVGTPGHSRAAAGPGVGPIDVER
ncbi:MAG: glycosyltransferase family 4 protein [bacterium]